MAETGLVQILEGALMAAGEPLSLQRMAQLFDDLERPSNDDLRTALDEVAARCEGRGYELRQVASGYRFQVRQNLATWVGRLWQERPQKYSRALLETLSLIAYRQPITRGEIEEIRGVAVSSNIIKTLQERDWVRIVGHRDVPGRPAMYATTRQFLDYFNLKSLEELPPLAEIKELDNLSGDLPLEAALSAVEAAGTDAANGDDALGTLARDADAAIDHDSEVDASQIDLVEGASSQASNELTESDPDHAAPAFAETSDTPQPPHAAEASIEDTPGASTEETIEVEEDSRESQTGV